MHRVTLPSTDITTSALGFGTAGLLRIGSERERQNVLAAAFDVGITHFDTAPIYGLGESERALGRFLRGRRDRVTLTTKFGLQVRGLTASLAFMQRSARFVLAHARSLRRGVARNAASLYSRPDYRADSVRKSLERSLRALGTNHVDLFLAHECSPDTLPDPELLDFLSRSREAGRIRAFGTASTFERTQGVRRARPELTRVMQFESDLFDRNVQGVGGACITHGALTRSVPRLRALLVARPDLAKRWSDCVGEDLGSDDVICALALRGSLLANRAGVVLMQSTSTRHVAANAREATSMSRDAAVLRLLELLAEEAPD